MLFLIIILFFLPAVITAIFGIIAERKKRVRANKKWMEFQEREAKSSNKGYTPFKMKKIIALFLLTSLVTGKLNGQSSQEERDRLIISYVGNMGVLLGSGNEAVLVDGFHKKYKPAYAYPSKRSVEEIIEGNYQNFGNLDMALITHHHKDHFDPAYYKDFLLKNPASKVIGSQHVIDQIRASFDDDAFKFENSLEQVPYTTEDLLTTHNGVGVRAFKCPHVNPVRHGSVQNIGYFININNYTILHLGDTHWDVAEAFLRRQNLGDRLLDIAILPYWMLYDKSALGKINQLIAAKQIIATHIPPDFDSLEYKTLKKRYPNATLFTELNETLVYKH